MSSKELLRRALPHWPHDALRPSTQLGAVLGARLNPAQPPSPPRSHDSPTASNAAPPPLSPAAVKPLTDSDSNAALGLLTNKFSRQYALVAPAHSACGGILTPRSNPGYYDALIRDLEAAPSRSWMQKAALTMRGMIRAS